MISQRLGLKEQEAGEEGEEGEDEEEDKEEEDEEEEGVERQEEERRKRKVERKVETDRDRLRKGLFTPSMRRKTMKSTKKRRKLSQFLPQKI